MLKRKSERTADIQKSLETRERFPLSYFDSRTYIQHNLNLEDGLGPILKFMDALPADQTKVSVRRFFEDGDYSVAHADYVLGDWGPMVGFEVHRWKDDRIVEHWDNLCSTPSFRNSSNRTMTDGSSEVIDIHKTAENKALVETFTNRLLVGGDLATISEFFFKDELIQHNPHYGDGVSTFKRQFESWQTEHGLAYTRVHKVLGEGSMVLVMSEGVFRREPTAFYDLYRVENGKIAEHWDVFETIPPRETWQNGNGKF
ncbi:MAG: hypothetical protein F6K28_04920 [Microcoleus sp. SIO2G3]|nr:hypothetical protein [Microcoleus sp. SIO2G3]